MTQIYKPFRYPWAYQAFKKQQQLHWLPDEVPIADDIQDWKTVLNDSERSLLTNIFRFFTQADIDVGDTYTRHYLSQDGEVWGRPEVRMMLTSFANMEGIHVDAYSYLLESIGMPETTYQEFLEYAVMKEKHEYSMQEMDPVTRLAVYAAFVEGLQLFASFVILLNFPRFGKMKGMGQIIAWSVRDETLHVESLIRLAKELGLPDKQVILSHAKKIVEIEDRFIDLAFSQPVHGISADEVKKYIRYICDLRLTQLGFHDILYKVDNPLPWVEEMLNGVEFANFFEARVTEYSKAATTGDWDDIF